MAQNISDFFRLARLGAGFDLEGAAKALELSSSAELINLESGGTLPPIDILYAMVNLYNLDPDAFIELLHANAVLHNDLLSAVSELKKDEIG